MIIRKLYRLSSMAHFGGIVLLASVFVSLGMPLVQSLDEDKKIVEPPPVTIKGVYLTQNLHVFPRFLEQIKHHNDVLIMGTSETSSLGKENYWTMLNNDKSVPQHFSVFGGAGRCCYVYFPLMLENPEAFRDLEILYFINPVYWRGSLNKFHHKYYDRYNSFGLAMDAKSEAKERGIYKEFVKPYIDKKKLDRDGLSALADYQMEDFRSYFYLDLDEDLTTLTTTPSRVKGKDYSKLDSNDIKTLLSGMNLELNATEAFLKEYGQIDFVPVDTGQFQYKALKAFIKLCKESGVKATFFVGPYNKVYAEALNPETVEGFEQTIKNLKSILDQEGMPYIDGSGLSEETGTFMDVQHHSKYGAWRIEQLIAKHYAEKSL